jgi:hypothetical protein
MDDGTKGDTFVGGAFSGILPDSPLLTDPRAAARSINDGEDRCVRTVSWYRFAVRYLRQAPYAQRSTRTHLSGGLSDRYPLPRLVKMMA